MPVLPHKDTHEPGRVCSLLNMLPEGAEVHGLRLPGGRHNSTDAWVRTSFHSDLGHARHPLAVGCKQDPPAAATPSYRVYGAAPAPHSHNRLTRNLAACSKAALGSGPRLTTMRCPLLHSCSRSDSDSLSRPIPGESVGNMYLQLLPMLQY